MNNIEVTSIGSPSGRGVPTPEEVAAIVAALEAAWPRVAVTETRPRSGLGKSWRFSGRWWAKPVASRRDRPW